MFYCLSGCFIMVVVTLYLRWKFMIKGNDDLKLAGALDEFCASWIRVFVGTNVIFNLILMMKDYMTSVIRTYHILFLIR